MAEFNDQEILAAEQNLLTRCLLEPEIIAELEGIVDVADIDEPLHRSILETIYNLRSQGRTPSLESVVGCLGNVAITDRCTLRQYLGNIAMKNPQVTPWRDTAETVREMSMRRQASAIGSSLMLAATAAADLDVALARAIDETQDLRARSQMARVKNYGAGAAADMALEHMAKNGPGNPTTGLIEFDKILGGWPRSEMSVVAARPGMGKSAVATSAVLRAARAGYRTLFFSLEMHGIQLGARMMTDLAYTRQSPILYEDILHRNVDERAAGRLVKAREILDGLPIDFEEQSGLSAQEISVRALRAAQRAQRRGQPIDVIVIDHMMKVGSSGRYAGNRVRELAEISGTFATLAKDLGVSVVALAQLNRGVEGRDNKRPGLADIRESGSIEEDASSVTFVYRPAYYLSKTRYDDAEKERLRLEQLERQKHTLELLVAKNRNGREGLVTAFVDIGANAIRNASYAG
ncbi:MAG: hypothetical protein K0U61_13675 [Alphaproteobacteria bacterium]|nr:hypothetical protein [Alphaproteobacteria bacterium]